MTAVSRFTDVTGAHPVDAIEWAVDEGITTGCCGDDKFCPDQPLTRSDALVFLERFYDRVLGANRDDQFANPHFTQGDMITLLHEMGEATRTKTYTTRTKAYSTSGPATKPVPAMKDGDTIGDWAYRTWSNTDRTFHQLGVFAERGTITPNLYSVESPPRLYIRLEDAVLYPWISTDWLIVGRGPKNEVEVTFDTDNMAEPLSELWLSSADTDSSLWGTKNSPMVPELRRGAATLWVSIVGYYDSYKMRFDVRSSRSAMAALDALA